MCFKIIKKDPLNANNRFKLLIKSAKKRNISVELNLDHYRKLLKLGCVYCGSDLTKEKGYCIDRHDNEKGYITENVSPCCKVCNRAKGKMVSPSFQLFFGPKNRVIIITRIRGIKVPTIP